MESKKIINICRVSSESQIDKIILTKLNKLVIIIFTYNDPHLKIFLKRELARQFTECEFVIAILDKADEHIHNFKADRGRQYVRFFLEEIEDPLPFVFFYYNQNCLATIKSAEPGNIA